MWADLSVIGRTGLGPTALMAAVVWAAACAPPLEPQGPRSTGASSRAFVGSAELELRYRYEPTSMAEVVLFVDASATGDGVGEVIIETQLEGFEPLAGPARWTLSVGDGQRATRQVTLRVLATATPQVTIVTTRSAGGVELARDTLRFLVTDTSLRECRPDDDACARP